MSSRSLHLVSALAFGVVSFAASGCDDPCALFGPDADLDHDGFKCAIDCNDLSADIYPGATELCDGWDNDCNGVIPPYEIDIDGDGYRACGSLYEYDCGPTRPEVHPGAAEFCDGMDNDCDPATPVWPGDDIDADGDGASACEDCDDEDPSRKPGAFEVCDGIDSDCNGIGDANSLLRHVAVAAEGDFVGTAGMVANIYDIDQDVALAGFAARVSDFSSTFGAPSPGLQVLHWDDASEQWVRIAAAPLLVPVNGDWWRTRRTLRIGLTAGERYMVGVSGFVGTASGVAMGSTSPTTIPFGQLEQHSVLSGEADPEALSEGDLTYVDVSWAQSLIWRTPSEIDQDGDGIPMCLDCDDAGAEICDGFDGDCDGLLAPDEIDNDLDGWVTCAGDCDDLARAAAPHEPEACDGIDMNCLPEGAAFDETDLDGDGFSPCQGDCNDEDASVWPGAPELCDSIDQDCDGDVDDWRIDSDGDGIWNCFDCAPHTDWIAPGLEDSCDSTIDLDCDGVVGNRFDLDGDGYRACEGDCDVGDPWVSPGVIEIPGDGIDNNCDGITDGSVPSVRVHWSDFAIETMEPFWGPASVRNPKVGGDFAIFTRAADGSVVDLESLEVDPLITGREDGTTPHWSDVTGALRAEGSVWLEAGGAVQVVLANLDPYEEIDVRLIPASVPFPVSASSSALSFGPSIDACDALTFVGGPADMLDALGGPGYFPWIDFNDASTMDMWILADGFVAGCDAAAPNPTGGQVLEGCQTLPSPEFIVNACKGLAASAPAVASSVSRVYWSKNEGTTVEGATLAGTGEISINTATALYRASRVMAHEAAHAYTNALDPTAPTPPVMQSWIAEQQAAIGPLPRVRSTFLGLAYAAAQSSAISSCGLLASYSSSASSSFDSQAFECGFAAADWYGRRNALEDIATWTAQAVVDVIDGNPSNFCGGIGSSVLDVPQSRVLHLAKVLALDLNGFLPESVSEGCVNAMLPEWTPLGEGDSRIWTLSSAVDGFDTEATFPPFGTWGPDTLMVESASPMEVNTRVHLVDPALAGTVLRLVPLNNNSNVSSLPYYYENPMSESYFERTQATGDGGNSECYFVGSVNSVSGTFGRSTDGVALVVRNAAQAFGVAYASPWKCAEITDAQANPPDVDFHEVDGSPVAFQAPAALGP